MTTGQVIIVWVVCLLAGTVHPLIVWSYARLFQNRRDSIKTLYLQVRTGADHGSAGSLGGILEEVNEKELNWRGFVPPLALCSALSIAGVAAIIQHTWISNPKWLTGDPLGFTGSLGKYIGSLTLPAVFGFAGAFLASVYSLVDRFRSLTLSRFLVHLAWFRLLFGVVVGAVLPHFVSQEMTDIAAFSMGFLPIREVLEKLRDVARKAFGSDRKGAPEETMWDLVQGATPDIVERLEEADVTSVAALGSQNPIALMQKTNVPWRVLLDLMDQAILVGYLGDKVKVIRPCGIRGAIEGAVLFQKITTRPDDGDAKSALTIVAQLLGSDPVCVFNLFRNLSEDSQVSLLRQLWFDRDADGQVTVPAGR